MSLLLNALKEAMENPEDIKETKTFKDEDEIIESVEPKEYNPAPSLYLNSKQYPEIKNYVIGEKIIILAECEVTNKNENQYIDEKGKKTNNCSVDLRIKQITEITPGD